MNPLKYCPPLRFTRENGEAYPNWEERPLSEYLVEYTEKTKIKNQYPVLTSSRSGLVLQTEHFNGQVTTEDNIGYHVIPYGYFTYRSRSDDGRFVFNRNTLIDKGIVSYFYPVFYVNGADPYFVWIYLNNFLSRQIVREIVGTSQLVLSFNKLKNLTIKIPSLPEQEKISSFFSLLDQKIEKQQEKIEQLELFKKGMLQKIFSQEIRFKDENGQDFPEWDVELFEQVVTNSSNKINPQSKMNVPCIELENIVGGRGQINGYFLSHEQQSAKNEFAKGSVLFGKLRPYLKKYWYATFDGVCSSEIWVLTSTSPRITNEFLYFIIQSDTFQQAANISSGSKMPRTEWDSIKSLEIPLPSIKEQKKIASFLFTLEEKISKEVSKFESLIQLKNGLLQQMFV